MATKNSFLIFSFFVATFFVADLFATEIYVWQDENGVTVYSDVKRPGAKKITLSENKVTIMKKADTSVFANSNSQTKKTQYDVQITSPSDKQTIRDNNGTLNILAAVTPSFTPNHNVQLLLDGKVIKPAQHSAVFVLNEIDRGEHSLQVQLLDKEGKVIASSNQVTVFMHRASVIGRN